MTKIQIEKLLESMYKLWIKNEPSLKHLVNNDIEDIPYEVEDKMNERQEV